METTTMLTFSLASLFPTPKIQQANGFLQKEIRDFAVGASEPKKTLFLELLAGATLADSEVNIQFFRKVCTEILDGRIKDRADLGRRVPLLRLVSDMVRTALFDADVEKNRTNEGLFGPPANNHMRERRGVQQGTTSAVAHH